MKMLLANYELHMKVINKQKLELYNYYKYAPEEDIIDFVNSDRNYAPTNGSLIGYDLTNVNGKFFNYYGNNVTVSDVLRLGYPK
jgi:hypothetical protein